MSTASDPEAPELPERLVEWFREALDWLNPEGERIGLAVSGGPDSMAMLLLAHAAVPGRFEVATVDHGIRPEAKAECAFVAGHCRVRDIPCTVLTVELRGNGNLLEEARQRRYEALENWAQERELPIIATAHQMDDQVETFLMRLARGSGISGLSAIRANSFAPSGWLRLIRPLLGFRREELEALVEVAGIDAVRDPSNEDSRFDRIRFRQALEQFELVSPEAIAASAANLADADAAISWAVLSGWKDRVEIGEDEVRYRHGGAPVLISMRIVQRAIARLGGDAYLARAVNLVRRLERGEQGNAGGVLVTIEGDEWVFRREPPRRTG